VLRMPEISYKAAKRYSRAMPSVKFAMEGSAHAEKLSGYVQHCQWEHTVQRLDSPGRIGLCIHSS
jgi:hypothetical protein